MGNNASALSSDRNSVSSSASNPGDTWRNAFRKKKKKKKKHHSASVDESTDSTDGYTMHEEIPVSQSIAPQAQFSKEPLMGLNGATKIEEDDTKEDTVLKTVQAKLKEQYLKFEMKSLPWMRENSVCTLQDYYIDLAIKEGGREQNASEEMKLEDIFSSRKFKKHLRILIEGDTGSGKTTLATKLAYDWSKEQPYISQFDVVLILPLRLFLGNLDDTLPNACCVKEEDKALFLKLAKDEAFSLLLILDGYDETSSKTGAEIFSLINKSIYPKSTVIMTSTPGKVTSKAGVAPTFHHLLDKRITVKGFSESQQKKFIEKHIAFFSEDQKANVRLKFDKMADKEVLSYPLFLLMLIVLFSSEEYKENTETKTDLYKRIFTLVFKEYFVKSRKEPPDLFSCKLGDKRPRIELMNQFSVFSLRVLNKSNLSFSKREIKETYKCDPEILELGFLKQCVSITGFSECLLYEPVHKSLLEFAAAYGLYLFYEENQCFPSTEAIIINRPTDTSSLFLPFLIGLMGENSGVLFDILQSYAFEYSWKFEQLHQSLLETCLTPSVLKPLTPFFPQAWNILRNSSKQQTGEGNFFTSSQHEAIVRWGVLRSKIYQVIWNVLQDTLLPTNVIMSNLVLDMQGVKNENDLTATIKKSTQYSFCVRSQKKLHCKYLWCSFSNYVYETEMSFENVFEFLQRFIDFQVISFDLSHSYTKRKDGAHAAQKHHYEPLKYIKKAVENGKLKRVHLHRVSTDKLTKMHLVNDLVITDRIEALELLVEDITQEEIDTFTKYAAESINLRNVVLSTDLTTAEIEKLPFDVNLTELCNKGQKSWEWVELCGLKVRCSENIESFLLFQHLEIISCVLITGTKLMPHCQTQSLYFPALLLADTWPHWPCQDSLTELNISVDAKLLYRGLSSLTVKLRNLQILALTMTPDAGYTFTLPVEQWISNAISFLRLKGFEIWSFSKNSKLATMLLAGLIKCLEDKSSVSTSLDSQFEHDSSIPIPSATEPLYVQYLMVNDIETESVQQAVTYLPKLKICLMHKRLTRLEMVFSTETKFPEYLQEDSLFSKYSIKQAFPHEEGFIVEHDLCGFKEDDSIYSKRKHLLSINQKGRIFITFKQKHNSVNATDSISI